MDVMRSFLRLSLLSAALALLDSGAPANAQTQFFRDGSDLHSALQQDGVEYSHALHYVVGVVDASNGSATRDGFCFDLGPSGIKASQIVDVVKNFLSANKRMWNRSGSTLVAAALQESWPCK